MNSRHAGIRRAGLAPTSRMSAKCTYSASPASSEPQQLDLCLVDCDDDGIAGREPVADERQRAGEELLLAVVEERVVPERLFREGAQAAADRCERMTQAWSRGSAMASPIRPARAAPVFAPWAGGNTRLQVAVTDASAGRGTHRRGGASVSLRDGRPSQTDGLALRLPATAEQVPVARRAVAEFCERCGLPAPLVDDVKLVTTEACTNVVLHAYDDSSERLRMFEVEAHVEPGVLLLSVSDQGRGIAAPSTNRGLGLGSAWPCNWPAACRRAMAAAGSARG